MDEYASLSHSKWECKYHVVFIPKCRRKTLYGELRKHLGEVFRKLAQQKESRIEEGHLMPDHDFDSAEIRGLTGGRFYQGQECHPFGPCVWRDAYALLPPTRTYNDAEIKKVLAESNIDAVLIINVGDTGVVKEYAGTFFQGQYSGTTDTSGTVTRNGNFSSVSLTGSSSGTMTGMSTPMHRYSRQTTFKARLVEPATARNLWVGSGEVSAGGRLFVGNGSNAASSVSAIFDDLQSKRIIGGTS